MLKITVPAREAFDSRTETFITTKETSLVLEHSLLSISKWEAEHKKCFLWCMDPKNESPLTSEEYIDYFRCMTINSNVDPSVYYVLTKENVQDIIEYINDPACATTVWHSRGSGGNKRIKNTAEVIYYYMITAGIPMECEKWHVNRLLALIDVCATMGGGKKMKPNETAQMYAELNKARRKQSGSKG